MELLTPETTHRLDSADFAALASGLGDGRIVGRLRAAQVSRRQLMLGQLVAAARSARIAEYFDVLVAAERRSPAAVRLLLLQPHVGAWLTATLRAVRGGSEAQGGLEARLEYMAGVALVAAMTAGVDAKFEVKVYGGSVTLPGLGRAILGDAHTASLEHIGGRTQLGTVVVPEHIEHSAGGWQAVRRLRCAATDLRIELSVDDVDPFRDCHQLGAEGRLSDDDIRHWQRLLDDAWPILVEHHRSYAEAIAAGLTTIVPLHSERPDHGMNVTSMEAFGAVSLTPPVNGRALALGLLHEFQHAKLGGLLDIQPLYERDDRPRHYAPWRDDPRPLGALLQGAYAFHGVVDFWRVQRRLLTEGPGQLAQVEFVRWRDRVWRTLDILEASGRFTSLGLEFLAGMRAAQSPWQQEAADAVTVAMAAEAADDHRVGWQLRNRLPETAAVRRLASAWQASMPCPRDPVPTETVRAGRMLTRSARLDLARLRIVEPARFAALSAGENATVGDIALAAGDLPAARRAYAAEIVATDRVDAWIGLALACQRDPDAPRLRFPELCMAVHRELSGTGDGTVDPLELATWLEPVECLAV
ncbi:HEXXH motif domain-containing protein [Phytohabitans aurantiacus]|jgi:HEXXH motif-containing protein|uniref:HEXXH motif domain-containing protein n=1 Tax=Phytohabitans aurantiacus TaxID=3016789 RepID=A0ABQ5QNH9_9ACTN|nr:HEXXH motif domain-containing protein [Phytohabitans aurantiacus]GLH95807.1 HEXXH motif domain-containing protein [Phytohabitans aurantiacus]